MRLSRATLGGLECHVVDALPADVPPRLVVVVCHGFGAPGTDLVPLAPELFAIKPELERGVRMIFPAAPLSLDEQGMYGGRAWWHLDVGKLMAAIETGHFRDLRNDCPDDLDAARDMLLRLIDEVQRDTGLPVGRFVLGGFSQGSMLATDVALHLSEAPAALGIFSGTLLCEDRWRALAPQRRGLKVLQSHGYQDPILPFAAAEWLRDLLKEAGMKVTFIPFAGMHTIPYEALEQFAALLCRALDQRDD